MASSTGMPSTRVTILAMAEIEEIGVGMNFSFLNSSRPPSKTRQKPDKKRSPRRRLPHAVCQQRPERVQRVHAIVVPDRDADDARGRVAGDPHGLMRLLVAHAR